MKSFLSARRVLILPTIFSASLSLMGVAGAQEAVPPTAPQSAPAASELELLRAQINALQGRLDQLEAQQKEAQKKAAVPAAAPLVTSNSKLPITVGGLAQVQGLGYLNQDGPAPRANDTFRLRRAEVRLSGNLTPRVSGLVVFDAAKALSANFTPGSNGGGTIAINRAGNILQDLQISYLARGLGAAPGANSTSIDVGQFKIPVGYEGALLSSTAVPFTERSVIYTARDPFGGGYGDVRDTGIQVRGTQGQFDYRVGLFNGFGERQNDLALSDNKAILGLLNFHPNRVPGLQIGISGGRDNTRTSVGQVARPERSIFNTFAVYKRDKFTFQGEYLAGRAHPLGTITERDIRGYYAGIGYLFTPKIEGLLRYDLLNTNLNAGSGVDTTVRDMILGVNYYIKGNNAKIQLNLVHRDGAAGGGSGAFTPPADLRDSRTEIRTQAQVAF